MVNKRNYIQARNLRAEAQGKLGDYEAIMGRTEKDYEALRKTGILCKAFKEKGDVIIVTRMCWNHLFKHPIKRPSRIDKLERALTLPLAIKLLQKTTTYQEVSKERDKGGNHYLGFGIIGYVRGNRIKVILRKQEKHTNAQLILYSFYQISHAPTKEPTVVNK